MTKEELYDLKHQKKCLLDEASEALAKGDLETCKAKKDEAKKLYERIEAEEEIQAMRGDFDDDDQRMKGLAAAQKQKKEEEQRQKSVDEIRGTNEYARSFAKAMKTNAAVKTCAGVADFAPLYKALQETGGAPEGADGGFLVPIDFDNQIIELSKEYLDLSRYFHTETVRTLSGWRVIEAGTPKALPSLEEMGTLGKDSQPKFSRVDYKVTWSGDKNSIVRKVTADVAYSPGKLPVPELGDGLTLTDGDNLFSGYVVRRSLDSEESKLSITCFDRGIYLCNNQGTYKFRGYTAEAIASTVCADRGIPVAGLASTGARLDRKFAAVALDKIVSTAYSLASEQTGERYAIRMTPAGLLVKVKAQSQSSLILRPRSNLIRASTTESIEKMVNSVAIYDEQGSRLSVQADQAAVDLYGLMQRHITQRSGEDASGEAKAILEDGALAKTVTVQVLGNSTLITGETVIAEEEGTGLSGLFWIESDSHTWARNTYQTRLTLNCRNVMVKTNAGSEIK